MILGQISWLDCIVFLMFLTPQLLLHVGLFRSAAWVLGATPFLGKVVQLPYHFIRERYFVPFHQRTPFVQHATPFQDFVIRCVRYAFAYMPASIGRVFFSKNVALPFLRFRMLRHGYLSSPLKWQEVRQQGFSGIWIQSDPSIQPDVVVYYCHGGGFSMGSSYFYMEFLLAWVTLLKQVGYKNPALFSLEYTLVPDAVYPKQVQEALSGYEYVLSIVGDPARVCIGGDSAGGTLMLSLLLSLSDHTKYKTMLPGMACMISPWVTVISSKNRNTSSDYLDSDSLHRYGSQYIGSKASPDDPIVSPGACRDAQRWRKASPKTGWLFLFGNDEVLAPETRDLIALLKEAGTSVDVNEQKGTVHAWPVAALYLGSTKESRLEGLSIIVKAMKQRIRPSDS